MLEELDIRIRQGQAAIANAKGQGQDVEQWEDRLIKLERLRHRLTLTVAEKPRPYLDADGTLVIPFDCDPKYHWWNGGQGIMATLEELDASEEVKARYKH